MDEFDKIREISEDLTNRREPTFTQFNQSVSPAQTQTPSTQNQNNTAAQQNNFANRDCMQNNPAIVSFLKQAPENPTQFGNNFNDKIDFIQVEPGVEKPFSSMKLHLIGISVFAGILGIILAGFFFFNSDDDNIDEVVTITTAPAIIKESPAQAGGMNIPDQDKLVYNRIRSDNVTTKVESLFPEPEKPVMPQILTIEDNTPDEKFVDMNKVKAINPLDEQPQKIISEKIVDSDKNVTQTAEKPKTDVLIVDNTTKPTTLPLNGEKTTSSTTDKNKAEVLPINKEKLAVLPLKEEAAVEQAKVEKPTIKEAQKSGNVWHAQLFSSNNKPAVEKAWKRIQNKHKSLLSNMSYEIETAKVKGKDWYRLKVGQFATRDMAATLCGKLKAQKQDCVPAK